MTPKQVVATYERLGKPVPTDIAEHAKPDASKFNSRKKEVDGHLFDSTIESKAYLFLKAEQANGRISELRLQPRFELQPAFRDDEGIHRRAITFKADFWFKDVNGDPYIVDVKGFRTPVYLVKLKLFKAKYPGLKFEEWNRQKVNSLFKGGW